MSGPCLSVGQGYVQVPSSPRVVEGIGRFQNVLAVEVGVTISSKFGGAANDVVLL
jgi:hypothetical protein